MQSADRDSKPGVGAKNIGSTAHHFNYVIQVWVLRGRVKACAHPSTMRPIFAGVDHPCCNAFRYQGLTESAAVAAHEKSNLIAAALRPH